MQDRLGDTGRASVLGFGVTASATQNFGGAAGRGGRHAALRDWVKTVAGGTSPGTTASSRDPREVVDRVRIVEGDIGVSLNTNPRCRLERKDIREEDLGSAMSTHVLAVANL